MFDLGQYVEIVKSGIKGYVVDVRDRDSEYTIEEDHRDDTGRYRLHDCKHEEVVAI